MSSSPPYMRSRSLVSRGTSGKPLTASAGLGRSWKQRARPICASFAQVMISPSYRWLSAFTASIRACGGAARRAERSLEDIYRTLVNNLALPEAIDRRLLRLQILGAVIWTSVWYKSGKATPDEIAANLISSLRLPLARAGAHLGKKAPASSFNAP